MNDFNKACSCPSGDGSLRHPCPAHPSPGGQDAPEIEQLRTLVSCILSTVSLGHQKGPYAYAGEDFGRYLAEAARDCRTILRALSDIAARQPARIYGCCAQPEGELHTAECANMRHLAARRTVNGLSWADYWIERGQPNVAHDFDAFSRADAWALQRFPDAGQPVGQLTDAEIDARLNTLYRDMVASGQHNGGMSGVAWDRAVYRMASSQSSGNSGELAVDSQGVGK